MKDMTFVNLNKQIKKTEAIINYNKAFGGFEESATAEDLILENQLIIMKALDRIDDSIRTLPR